MDEEMEKIKSIARSMRKKPCPAYDFEDFLTQKYFEDGGQDKDVIWDWISELPIENLIEWAGEFAEQCVRRVKCQSK